LGRDKMHSLCRVYNDALLVKIMLNKLNGISFALIHIQFYNIGTDGENVVLNKLYDISFAIY
jgi:hypothetical protein